MEKPAPVSNHVAQVLAQTLPNPFNNTPSINNTQLIKLIIQYLSSLGSEFQPISHSLTELTGLQVSDKLTSQLETLLKDTSIGLDDKVSTSQLDDIVDQLTVNSEIEPDEIASIKARIKILVRKRLFLETLILSKNSNAALRIIRNMNKDFFSDEQDKSLIRKLSNILVSLKDSETESGFEKLEPNNEEFKVTEMFLKNLNWEIGSDITKSRESLIQEIISCLPSDTILPPDRLLELVHQALTYQQQTDPYYIPTNDYLQNFTLFKDLSSGLVKSVKFPNQLKFELEDHSSECWFVKYSNNGKYLASASVDKTITIYSTDENYKIHRQLIGHSGSIIYLSWSADDSKLITSSFDQNVKVWDIETGEAIRTLSNTDFFKSSLRMWSIEFFTKNDNFIIASPDRKLSIFNLDADLIYDFEMQYRVDDLCIINDEKLLAITHSCQLLCYDLTTSPRYTLKSTVPIGKKLTSITKSPSDPDHVLINVKPDEMQLWNVADLDRPFLVNKYYGLQQSDYIIRGCVSDKNLVLSGSEDGAIFIWNKKYGNLIDCFQAHGSLINCIDWRPKGDGSSSDEKEFEWASCGDDGVVNIWGF
ncbi:hypothetical protein CANARDRAFT_200485 [[Candida] arabinofermentans NRRL YB-2248]|uniref:CTLH domain-containing protein n=1 Tax=[Candida] arabinofermentans NRRL YB-2248 TaxID=983967 RepID=A0A1E4SZG4_9ASCO|nr:hypothetical protein CANARDRAFT_200485 [[Candida] arabinofermentans NRRL YB-2248]